MKKINYKFWGISIGLIVLLGLFYFKYSLIVPPDGSDYYYYVRIFDGLNPFSTWETTRGFSFPILLYLFKHLFGDNSLGILTGFFLFHLLLVGMGALILNTFLKEYNKGRNNFIYWLLFVVLIMFNPLIIGYSHTLLTEAVAPGIIMLSSYLIYKWTDVSWSNDKLKLTLYTFSFALIMVFMWFLKQPYMPIIFFLVFISSILISIKQKSWHVFLERMICTVSMVALLLISIVSWNFILDYNHVNKNLDKSSSNFLASGIVDGLNYHYRKVDKKTACSVSYIENSTLNETEKKEILALKSQNKNWCDYFYIYSITNKDGVIEQVALITQDNRIAVSESIAFWFKSFVSHPLLIMHTYYKNYMATIDLYNSYVIPGIGYIPGNELNFAAEHENTTLGLATYTHIPLCWWLYWGTSEEILQLDVVKNMKNFEGWQEVSEKEETFIKENVKPFYLMIFRITLLLALPLAIYSFVEFMKHKQNKIYYFTTILFASSFFHILFHAVMGALIDRYAFVVMPITILGIILLIVPKESSVKEIKVKKTPFKKDGKLLFVIPAYNEEKNIEKVVKDIQKNMPTSDIVITNDCSKDNTKVIVESLGIPCLNVPFNMGYAMAMQTGIKYAYENNYDYVIQFDGDGQHLASEAKKLLQKMEETNANIIIGSRFLEKTDYKHPLFRKIGTKIFQILIKIFCHKKITDPTSGFQLLDRYVIERYAKIGKYPEFPDANLIIEMLLNGYEIEEVSVQMKLNDTGQSMHGGIIKPIKYMINVLYTIMFIFIKGRYIKEDK